MVVFTIFFVMLQHSSAWLYGPTFTCYRALLTAICCNQGFNNSYSSGFFLIVENWSKTFLLQYTGSVFFQKTDRPLLLDWTGFYRIKLKKQSVFNGFSNLVRTCIHIFWAFMSTTTRIPGNHCFHVALVFPVILPVSTTFCLYRQNVRE
jgi:hypothetical protein